MMERTAPSRCDLMIVGGTIVDLDAGSARPDGQAIAISNGVIVAIGPQADIEQAWTPARRLDASGQLVTAGFIDAHVHLGSYLGAARPYVPAAGPGTFSGSADGEQIMRMVAEFCSMQVPADVAATVVRPAFAAMLRAGFTGVVDAGGPGADGIVQAAAELGIRAAIGPSLADQWHDEAGDFARRRDTDDLLAEAERFVDQHDRLGDGRIRALVSAVEPTACSDELLAGIAEITRQRNLPVHVHSHINDDSARIHEAAWGRSQTKRLDEAGLLNDRCTIMHAGSLDDDDIEAFAHSGTTVNHNPTGNALYGFGITAGRSVPRLLDAGVPVVLGSDFAPTTTNPFELMRAALMLHRDVAGRQDALTLEQALAMATTSSAPLGCPQLGRVAVGQTADLVMIDITGPHHLASTHPVPALTLHARVDDVTTVIVDGHVVVKDRQLLAIDEVKILDEAHAALRVIAGRTQ